MEHPTSSSSSSSLSEDRERSGSDSSNSSDNSTPSGTFYLGSDGNKRNSIEVVSPQDPGPKEVSLNTSDPELSKENRSGLLKLFTKAVGLDITTVAIPVSFNEPASFLMRLCEAIQYTELLDKAAQSEDPMERLMYVAVFACSVYAVAERTGKPFNPILGETYEYTDPKREDFKFIGEQVSHHPPVGACFAENKHWKFYQSQSLKTRFTGNSLDCQAVGLNNVVLKRTNEHFKWEGVRTIVHNLIIGKLWLDHHGDLEVLNRTTGDKAKLKLKECGWFSKGWHEVEGDVYDKTGIPYISISGKWNEAIYAKYRLRRNQSTDSFSSSSDSDSSISSKDSKKRQKAERKGEKEGREKD